MAKTLQFDCYPLIKDKKDKFGNIYHLYGVKIKTYHKGRHCPICRKELCMYNKGPLCFNHDKEWSLYARDFLGDFCRPPSYRYWLKKKVESYGYKEL